MYYTLILRLLIKEIQIWMLGLSGMHPWNKIRWSTCLPFKRHGRLIIMSHSAGSWLVHPKPKLRLFVCGGSASSSLAFGVLTIYTRQKYVTFISLIDWWWQWPGFLSLALDLTSILLNRVEFLFDAAEMADRTPGPSASSSSLNHEGNRKRRPSNIDTSPSNPQHKRNKTSGPSSREAGALAFLLGWLMT